MWWRALLAQINCTADVAAKIPSDTDTTGSSLSFFSMRREGRKQHRVEQERTGKSAWQEACELALRTGFDRRFHLPTETHGLKEPRWEL